MQSKSKRDRLFHMMLWHVFLLISLPLLAWAEQPGARAILEKRCLACHSGQYKKSGLDLSRRDLAIRGGDRGPAIVPGNSKESLLFKVASHTEEPHMPFKAARLPDAELAAIAEWIDKGAAYDEPVRVRLLPKRLQPCRTIGLFILPNVRPFPPSRIRIGCAIRSTHSWRRSMTSGIWSRSPRPISGRCFAGSMWT